MGSRSTGGGRPGSRAQRVKMVSMHWCQAASTDGLLGTCSNNDDDGDDDDSNNNNGNDKITATAAPDN